MPSVAKISSVLICIIIILGISHISHISHALSQFEEKFAFHTIKPSVRIIDPPYCESSMPEGQIMVRGVSHSERGVSKVEFFVHSYPFDQQYSFQLAKPIEPKNWTSWSAIINVTSDGPHRILVRATDFSGNENWDERIIDLVSKLDISTLNTSKQRIAFVEPIFTEGAYNHAFYDFYSKYKSIPVDQLVTTDLNLLTAQIPRDEYREYWNQFVDKVKKYAPDSSIYNITDGDIDQGIIFDKNGKNNFNVLFLFHSEYVTQTEYNNLKNFVYNGGTLVAIDGNIFYAQVKYDKERCTVTLMRGHDWEFGGNSAIKGVSERFADETRFWIGSNFIINDISDRVLFGNNPFNYKHFEENYVSNEDALILQDYLVKLPDNQFHTPLLPGGILVVPDKKIVASYELIFGKGKVIMLGLYGQRLADSQLFMNFFDKIILTRALGSKYDLSGPGGLDKLDIYWKSNYWTVTKIAPAIDANGLVITFKGTDNRTQHRGSIEKLKITIPKTLIGENSPAHDIPLRVTADGKPVKYSLTTDDIEVGLDISIPTEAKEISVIGVPSQ